MTVRQILEEIVEVERLIPQRRMQHWTAFCGVAVPKTPVQREAVEQNVELYVLHIYENIERARERFCERAGDWAQKEEEARTWCICMVFAAGVSFCF